MVSPSSTNIGFYQRKPSGVMSPRGKTQVRDSDYSIVTEMARTHMGAMMLVVKPLCLKDSKERFN